MKQWYALYVSLYSYDNIYFVIEAINIINEQLRLHGSFLLYIFIDSSVVQIALDILGW